MIQSIKDGRKEDGIRSIADKIIKRLHDLDKMIESNQGRWAWELLQNAKDSIAEDNNRKVSIQIELNENSVEFRHNGAHFTEQDIRGLINQISSKEVEEGQQTKKVGRFGTGFLTTHLLSRAIQVKGIVEAENGDFYGFNFLLDRQATKIDSLKSRIQRSWDDFDNSVENNQIDSNYNRDEFNTSFLYRLETEAQKEIAQIGVEEFLELAPFVLTFIPKISRVEIIDKTTQNITIFENNQELQDNLIMSISKAINGEETDILILYAFDDKVAIATEVEKAEKGYSVKGIKHIPKLFCDFPLIGTENFHFPVVVNSFFFNPQTERDGIWLKGDDDLEVQENRKLLENAVVLYKDLVSRIAEKNYFNLYNLAETKIPSTSEKYFDEGWYKEFIQNPLREFIYNANIIEIEDEYSEKKAIKDLWFPRKSLTRVIKETIWQFIFDLYPNVVCSRKNLHNWCNLSWDSWQTLDYQVLSNTLQKLNNIQKLSQTLKKSEDDTFDWLNSLFKFILEDESNLYLFEKSQIIPNKNGIFKSKTDLYIDEIRDNELIDVLELLGEDWNDILQHDSIKSGTHNIKKQKDIAINITEKLKTIYNNDDDKITAINLLSEWFENNPKSGKDLFSELYNKRAELFMNTIKDKDSLYKVMRNCTDLSKLVEVTKAMEDNPKMIENIQKGEEITKLLQEFNVNDISELKEILISSRNNPVNDSKILITQETLLSFGVISIEELEEALKDKGVADQFFHISTPTQEMFFYVQELIKRSKNNIIKYLKTLPDYDCSEYEELATTVIGGIKKEGLLINVVIRPSDNGEVIFHYSSEKDTLDIPNTELWIDNGIDQPRCLTLGKILKKTGINRIPV